MLPLLSLARQANAQGSITLVNTARGSDVTGANLPTIATGPGTFIATSGNLIVAALSWYNDVTNPTTATLTDTAGNVYTLIDAIGQDVTGKIALYYAKNISGHASNQVTATIAGTGRYVSLTLIQYSGADTTSPLDGAQHAVSAFAASLTTGGFNTTSNNELIVFAARNGAGGSYVAGPFFAIQVVDANGVHAMEDQAVAPPTTGLTASMSNGTAASWQGVWATFKAATATSSRRNRVISQQ